MTGMLVIGMLVIGMLVIGMLVIGMLGSGRTVGPAGRWVRPGVTARRSFMADADVSANIRSGNGLNV
ncbi:hypothetical protein [Nonomuraea fuscirosea]|uniref:hypothetical protein n=1 Tax=Nonomuraea fuscirosea TaxID=1291556 RepID=UPI00343792A6